MGGLEGSGGLGGLGGPEGQYEIVVATLVTAGKFLFYCKLGGLGGPGGSGGHDEI